MKLEQQFHFVELELPCLENGECEDAISWIYALEQPVQVTKPISTALKQVLLLQSTNAIAVCHCGNSILLLLLLKLGTPVLVVLDYV